LNARNKNKGGDDSTKKENDVLEKKKVSPGYKCISNIQPGVWGDQNRPGNRDVGVNISNRTQGEGYRRHQRPSTHPEPTSQKDKGKNGRWGAWPPETRASQTNGTKGGAGFEEAAARVCEAELFEKGRREKRKPGKRGLASMKSGGRPDLKGKASRPPPNSVSEARETFWAILRSALQRVNTAWGWRRGIKGKKRYTKKLREKRDEVPARPTPSSDSDRALMKRETGLP